MIEWLKDWTEGIIIAVIITILIEMILPEGKNKKYVKVVSGIYILYTIINPILVQNDVSSFSNFNEYMNINTVRTSSKENIQDIYIASLEKDLKEKIETTLKYNVKEVIITCNLDYSEILFIEVKTNEINTDIDSIKNIIIENYQIDSSNIKVS